MVNDRHRRSFASFRFRPRSLESFMMINKAYEMMESINDIVGHDSSDQQLPNERELKEQAKQRAKELLLNWRTELWRIIINKEHDWMLGEILVEAGYCFLLCVITVLSK